jgi:hypothetical protein
VVNVVDASGDGHHLETDILSAWLVEPSAGSLAAVLTMRNATWRPEHLDEETITSGAAVVFRVNGGPRQYLRVSSDEDGPEIYDHGTWSAVGGFAAAGAATGRVTYGFGGAVVIDAPVSLRVTPGDRVTEIFGLTYDGVTGGVTHWVDRAPGGTDPVGTAFGADYVVGACAAAGDSSGNGGGAGGSVTDPAATSAVALDVVASPRAAGVVTVRGRVVPARAGVSVTVERRVAGAARSGVVRTASDGTYVATLPLRERTSIRASVGDVRSQSVEVAVRSRVSLAGWRNRSGAMGLTATVYPGLRGRILVLRPEDVRPVRVIPVVDGRAVYRLALPRGLRGSFDAVYEPAAGRALSSSSQTVRVR